MNVLRPSSLDDACRAMAEADEDDRPVPLAGGTDLLVRWPENLGARERTYLDLWGVDELRDVRLGSETLELGALATYWDVIADREVATAFPLLEQAARTVGAIQIQSRGTWAGNVANGSPAADGVPVLMAYDARVVLASTEGRREVPLDAIYLAYRRLDVRPDELIAAIRLPRRERARERFVKVGSRRAQAIAKVGLAVVREPTAGWRVVAASVAPTVRRCSTVERLLDDEGAPERPEDFLPAIREDVEPIDDVRSTAEYRERVLTRVLHDAVTA